MLCLEPELELSSSPPPHYWQVPELAPVALQLGDAGSPDGDEKVLMLAQGFPTSFASVKDITAPEAGSGRTGRRIQEHVFFAGGGMDKENMLALQTNQFHKR